MNKNVLKKQFMFILEFQTKYPTLQSQLYNLLSSFYNTRNMKECNNIMIIYFSWYFIHIVILNYHIWSSPLDPRIYLAIPVYQYEVPRKISGGHLQPLLWNLTHIIKDILWNSKNGVLKRLHVHVKKLNTGRFDNNIKEILFLNTNNFFITKSTENCFT